MSEGLSRKPLRSRCRWLFQVILYLSILFQYVIKIVIRESWKEVALLIEYFAAIDTENLPILEALIIAGVWVKIQQMILGINISRRISKANGTFVYSDPCHILRIFVRRYFLLLHLFGLRRILKLYNIPNHLLWICLTLGFISYSKIFYCTNSRQLTKK